MKGFLGECIDWRLARSVAGHDTGGWLSEGVSREGDRYLLRANRFSAQLVCAAVPRREVISGWDLFRWIPKDARRVAPAGSVYWFDQFEGDAGTLAEWVANGLWGENIDPQRRAEGYKVATLGNWI